MTLRSSVKRPKGVGHRLEPNEVNAREVIAENALAVFAEYSREPLTEYRFVHPEQAYPSLPVAILSSKMERADNC